MTELDLILSLKRRDGEAYTYLFDNYAAALYGVISSIVADKETAQHVLRQAFIKIWNNITEYPAHNGRLYTWLLAIARNTALDTLRSQNETTGAQAPTTRTTTHTHMQQLCPDCRAVIDMIYHRGYTVAAAATELRISEGMVVLRLRKGIKVFRGNAAPEFTATNLF